MARPKKNNADYFPHLTGLRNHRKIKILKNKFGNILGYAFWCMMLEWLTEHDGLEFEYSELEFEMFAAELGVSAAEIPPMIDLCVKLELLFKNDDGFIYSESLNDALNPVFEKRNKEREKSKSRQRKQDGTFETLKNPTCHGVSAAEIPQSKVKKSKEKKSNISEASSDGVYKACMILYDEFIFKRTGVRAKINSLTGVSLKKIISYLKTQIKNKEGAPEIEIPNALRFVFDHYERWTPFHQGQLNLNQIESNLINILNSVKNGNPNSNVKPISKYATI